MPIVFVHGVSVRRSAAENAERVRRNGYLLAYLPDACGSVPVANPPWGKYGVDFRWGLESMPKDGEVFGAEGEGVTHGREILETVAPGVVVSGKDVLLQIARHSLANAIDALWWATALDHKTAETNALALASRHALAFARERPADAQKLVARMRSDDDLVNSLLEVAKEAQSSGPDDETFGSPKVYDPLARANKLLRGAVAVPAAKAFRRTQARKISLFVGDLLVYVDTRGQVGQPGKIVRMVSDAFRAAKEPLVVIGHSMGGNIAYDVLTYFAPDVHCSALVTVGSQVALFEEMTMFRASDRSVRGPAGRVARPANVDRWINVYDPVDVLAYKTEPVFTGTDDVPFRESASVLGSHGDYFARPTFYELLAERLARTS